MLHTTRGIVLRQIKYSETSLIVKIYTEILGMQSFLIKGVRSKKSKIKPALLQPLSIVDLEIDKKEKKDLQNIKEIKSDYQFNSIPHNIYKSSIVIFITEILNKVIHEEESNSALFTFLVQSIKLLDSLNDGFSSFHYKFLVELSNYLGFYPNITHGCKYFNLEEGTDTNLFISHQITISSPLTESFHKIIITKFDEIQNIKIHKTHRKELLEVLIRYYQLHLPGLGEIKSHKVLDSTFND